MLFSKEELDEMVAENNEKVIPIYTKSGRIICFIDDMEYAIFVAQTDMTPGEYIEQHRPNILKEKYTARKLTFFLREAYNSHYDDSDECTKKTVNIRLLIEKKKDEIEKVKAKYPREYFAFMYPDYIGS